MEYFSLLQLKKEPFSNSPDPELFFDSCQHTSCLQKLELSLRLKRGLNVVIGDVGLGKTTCCRQLIRKFVSNDKVETHLILDPGFKNALEFFLTIAKMFGNGNFNQNSDHLEVKEYIKQYLFQKGVEENTTVILIIDEGQKIPDFCLEILRELLNYETNKHKLLQIVIFAQNEFEKAIKKHNNFADRINLYHPLKPLNFKSTRQLIRYRLKVSSETATVYPFFTYLAQWAIYKISGGYPRKIINLCHLCLLAMIIQNKSKIGFFHVQTCAQRALFKPVIRPARIFLSAFIIIAISGLFYHKIFDNLPNYFSSQFFKSGKKTNLLNENMESAKSKKKSEKEKFIAKQKKIMVIKSTKVDLLQNNRDKKSKNPAIKLVNNTTDLNSQKIIFDKKQFFRNDMPMIIGQVAVKKNETLSDIILNTYGIFNIQYLAFVIKYNPHLNDPDDLKIGYLVRLPAIPVNLKPADCNIWWISLDKKKNLSDAFELLRSYPKDVPPVRIIPFWKQKEGFGFEIVLKRYFFKEKNAALQFARLSPFFSAKKKIISRWDDDIVFFADPFLSKEKKGRLIASF